jgi:hypothetical protein
MKKGIYISLSLFLLVGLFSCHNKEQKQNESGTMLAPPLVDKRVELLSIVFRLAGCHEYSDTTYKDYVSDIHKHFDKYKDHPLIKYTKELRDSNGIGYDAVMQMAIHIDQPPSLRPLVTFTDSIPETRWGSKAANKFDSLLQQFYKDADCETFFKQEESRYATGAGKFKMVYDSLDLNWYKDYYGTMPTGKYNIVVGLGNGGCNFGVKIIYPGDKEEVYAIEGTWRVDGAGAPTYKVKEYLPVLIHEFNHSFVNHLIDKNLPFFEMSGNTIYKEVSRDMKAQAYTDWKIMMYESVVRASVIEYLKKHDSTGKQAEQQTVEELSRGFLWIRELVTCLDKYQKERDKYPTLESYIPEIAKCFDSIANNIPAIKAGYFKDCPHVTKIEQFENNATNVSPSLKTIKMLFDKPLRGQGYSFNCGNKGEEAYPDIDFTKFKYSNDNKAIELSVTLKPNTEYQFVLTGRAFKTPEGFGLVNDTISFKTSRK